MTQTFSNAFISSNPNFRSIVFIFDFESSRKIISLNELILFNELMKLKF